MYVIAVIIIIVVLFTWINVRNILQRKDTFSEKFGKEKGSFKYEDEIATLSYYNNSKKTDKDIDDITWNDLDMNRIYNDMNTTLTNTGEEYLYSLLHKVEYENTLLVERERVTKILNENEYIRIKLQVALCQFGKIYNSSMYETLDQCRKIHRESLFPHLLICFSVIFSCILLIWNYWVGGIYLGISLTISILSYYRTMRKIPDSNQWNLKYFAKMIRTVSKISKLHCDELDSYFIELRYLKKLFKGVQIKSFFVSSGVGFIADTIDLLLDYLRIFTHINIIMVYDMSKIIEKNFIEVERIFELIGFFDSMIAIASYKRQLPYYSTPKLRNDGEKQIQIIDIYHPLVEKPVVNSINEQKGILLTGSNASGKSTFLKAIAINAIFAQTMYLSTSRSYTASYFQIYTSMALTDNLYTRDSYFIVEIKALKRILEQLNKDIPILCCIDEVLRGTNTLERIAASSEILAQLGNANVICVVATHDIELAHILASCYENYHFKEEIVGDQVVFNYKLYNGMSTTRNAIKLLKMLGYSTDIVNKSNCRLDEFMNSGIWNPVINS
jgi:hypothetical protein